MLKIREMREDRAGVALTAARNAKVQAEKELESKRSEFEKYMETKEQRRDRIYDQIIGRPVSLDDLDDARTAVTRVDEEGVLLEQAEKKAADVVETKTREAESARVQFVAASRNRMKIDEHRSIWIEEARKEEERAADAEMEEFTGKKNEE